MGQPLGLTNLLKRNDHNQEPFFALEISHELVKAAVWTVQDKQVSIINTGEITAVEGNDEQSLLDAVNMALTTANDELDQEPDKIIFGFPEHWTNEQGILPEKKEVLKFLCKKLELKPMGYVITVEALVTYLKQQQGTPPTAIFVRVSDTELIVSLVTLGKISKREVVGRSDNIVNDLREGLKRFDYVEQLPARIILYDGMTDFEDIKQQLQAHSWEEEFPFSHIPRIDSLASETSVEAIAIAGGKEVAASLGIDVSTDDAYDTKSESQIHGEEDVDAVVATDDLLADEALPDGFTIGDRVDSEVEMEPTQKLVHTQAKSGRIGFGFTGLLAKSKGLLSGFKLPKSKKKVVVTDLVEDDDVADAIVDSEEKLEKKFESRSKPRLQLPSFKFLKRIKIWPVLLVTFLLLAGSAWGVWYIIFQSPTAIVTIFLNPKTVDANVAIIALPDSTDVDLEALTLPAIEAEADVEGSETIQTTGTKRIGKTAEGKVTIYNKTSSSKKFSANTVLVGSDNLRFVLTQEVTVASSSAQETDGGATIAYGKADVNVEAGSIGEEYNVASGTEMSFKDFDEDDYSAKASVAFAGGTSETIKVVAKEDRALALEALTKKLEAQAKQQIEQATGDRLVVGSGPESEITDYTFDAETGDETESLTVQAKLTVSTMTVDKNDFHKVLVKAVDKSVPQAYSVLPDQMTYEIKLAEEAVEEVDKTEEKEADKKTTDTATGIKLAVSVKVNLQPNMDFPQLKQTLAGKKPEAADAYLKTTIFEFNYADIAVTPKLPGDLATIPRNAEKITIKVEQIK